MTGTTRDSSDGRSRSDSSEPWDERPEDAFDAANKKDALPSAGASVNSKLSETDMVRTDLYIDKTEPLEDGDLPPLSLSRSVSGSNEKRNGLVISGNTQKPSEAELNKQRAFWSQLDDSPSLHTSGSETQRKLSTGSKGDEGPDDEMNAERAETREATRTSARNDRDTDYIEQMRVAESEDSDDSKESKEYVVGEQEETNFCDHTLSAMESICGQDFCGGDAGRKTSKNPNLDREGQPQRGRSSRKLQLYARGEDDSVEEHTAIEVEYVEPEQSNALSQERPENWSPSRKNAYLAAMARKAKEDYERSQAKEMASMSPRRKPSKQTPEESAEDVYNTFTASEKRKFLRLINSGLSSTESAERVRSERKDKSKDEKKESKKGKLFKFWKKGSSKSKDATKDSKMPSSPQKQTINYPDDASSERVPPEEEKKEDDTRMQEQSVASQEAVAPDGPSAPEEASREAIHDFHSASEEVQADSVAQARSNETETGDAVPKNASQSQVDRFRESLQQAQVTQAVMKSMSSDAASTNSPRSPSRNSQNKSYVASTEAGTPSGSNRNSRSVTSTNTFEYRDEGSTDDNGFDGRFAKSGINYYDAVRRDFSESEEDSDFPISPSRKKNTRSSHLSPIIPSPKLKGFSKLTKGGKSTFEGKDDVVNMSSTPGSNLREQAAVVVTPDAAKRPDEEEKTETPAQDFGGTESVASATPSAVGREVEAFSKVEQELLRPVRKSNTASVVSPEPTIEQTRNIVSPIVSQAEKEADFSMQDYLSSTEAYSASGFGNDNMSVVSGKSFSTAETSLHGPASVYTQSSTLTQSSRKRRPGAAKSRLAKAKEAEKHAGTKQGWHESIRAAAQTTNRVWKPKVGWVDYEEPDYTADLSTGTMATDMMHLNLGGARHKKGNAESNAMKGSPIENAPESRTVSDKNGTEEQPPMVEDSAIAESSQLKQPLQANGSSPASDKFHGKSAPFVLDDMSVEQSVAHSVDQFVHSMAHDAPAGPSRRRDAPSPSRVKRMATSPSKRIGWIDSMKAASANVGKDGQSWDPMSGWAHVAEDEPQAQSGAADQGTDEERQTEYGTDPAEDNADALAPSSREPSSEENAPEESQRVVLKLPAREGHLKKDSAMLDKWAGKESKGPKSQMAMPIHGTDIDDNDTGLPRDDSDDVPLLTASEDFAEEEIDKKMTVNVVREKVGEDDLNWFPKQQPRRGSTLMHASDPTNVSTQRNEQSKERQDTSMQRSIASSKSSRRTAGPVDVDEVENMEIDSEEDEKGVVWDGVVFETDFNVEGNAPSPPSTSPPSSSQQVSGASKSGSSVTSLSSYSKTVPKLSQSKRDTSPIRGRKAPESSRSAWRDNATTSMSANRDPEPSHSAAHEDMHSTPGSPSQRASNTTDTFAQQAPDPPDFQPQSVHDDSSAPSASSSIVKLRAQQWESKSRAPTDASAFADDHGTSNDKSRLNAATAEWKSFLGKKVQAENEAAAREKERMQRGNGIGEPRVMYDDVEQNDSLFDFSRDGSFPTSPSAISSPSRSKNHPTVNDHRYSKNLEDSTEQIPPTEGSDFSDGNEINKGFFTRLAGCAAPMLPKRGANGELPHLAFLRTDGRNGASSKFMPQYLCGRPDVIHEEANEDGDEPAAATKDNKSTQLEPKKPEYKAIQTKGSEVRGDTRSVISEDFGAKTAYLEALAMKTAVSKPKRSSSRSRGDRSSTGASEISVSTSKSHKEKWKDFLERKSAAGASPVKSKASGSEASAAAEMYAAKKVEEMMAMMASRSKSTPRSWRSPDQKRESESRFHGSQRTKPYDLTRQRSDPANKFHQQKNKTDSVAAAEALAAARVNAMMEALANSNKHSPAVEMEEGEI